ncbi:MAG TPA: hypothetical protein PJ984_02950 [Candidatus Saccharibacteria bacterium]|nr:hypothetical protein [Patescibacteria group bacterium]HMS31327.1 hypothetical protein [Candidatus Saccharibacteria bacterium]
MSVPCENCPVRGVNQIAEAEISDDPMIRVAGRVARIMLERGDRGERGPMYTGIEMNPETGEDFGPRFECCNRNASLAATVVGAAILATQHNAH